jgi:two-component system, chemotaxis family, response regulator Rcp1
MVANPAPPRARGRPRHPPLRSHPPRIKGVWIDETDSSANRRPLVQVDAHGPDVALAWTLRVLDMRAASSRVFGTGSAGRATREIRRQSPARAGRVDRGMMKSAHEGGRTLKGAAPAPAARIVVIEDNSSDVFLLDRALKQQDLRFELIHLPTGDEALAYVRRQGAFADAPIPSLILVDLNLARYTGQDIVRGIRAAGHLAGVPICVWSSSRSRRDEATLEGLGVSKFITKPSGLDQFMDIGEILRGLLSDAGFR